MNAPVVMQRATHPCICLHWSVGLRRPFNPLSSALSTRQQAQKQHRNLVACTAASNQTSSAPSAQSRPKPQQMLVHVPPHPLIKHWLAVARNRHSPTPIFRAAIAELGRLLIYELGRDWLPTMEGTIESPVGPADAEYVDPSRPIKVVPILRAGLILVEQISTVLPSQETFHVGYARNEETLQASSYLNKLPKSFSKDDKILVADPMLATGGTVVNVLDDIIARGADASQIIVVCIVAAPPALRKLSEKFLGLKVYAAMIDAELNDKGYIVPGLGDAGDRAYGTL